MNQAAPVCLWCKYPNYKESRPWILVSNPVLLYKRHGESYIFLRDRMISSIQGIPILYNRNALKFIFQQAYPVR